MDSGYYAACAGLRAQTETLELIANNVANINTAGFRGQQPRFSSLLAVDTDPAGALSSAVNNFNVLEGSRVDLSPGNLEPTGNPLDMGIEGKGFFAVQSSNGVIYTRNGSFQVSAAGRLTTSAGDPVLGDQGAIVLPSGKVSVSGNGTISVDGAVAGKLRVVEFAPGSSPLPVGKTYYAAADSAVQRMPDASVRQGMLESSNVNAVTAVTELITAQRRAEMLERALSLFHSNLNHIAASDLPHV